MQPLIQKFYNGDTDMDLLIQGKRYVYGAINIGTPIGNYWYQAIETVLL